MLVNKLMLHVLKGYNIVKQTFGRFKKSINVLLSFYQEKNNLL